MSYNLSLGESVFSNEGNKAIADVTPPTVSLTAPVTGVTASGTVMVSASATDNVGVVGVQFKLDGVNLGAEDTTNTYSISWNSTLVANGTHTLTAVARDAAGNLTTSAPVSATVANDTIPPVISSVSAFNISSSQATITWATNQASDSQVEYGLTTAYGSSTPLNSSLLTAHAVTLTGLLASNTYHYRVKSRDAAGNLATSADFTLTTLIAVPDITPPSVPTNLSASAMSSLQMNLSWTASTDNVGVAGYTIYRGGSQIATTSLTSYSDTGLSPSTAYAYTVAAYDAAGNVSVQAAPASAVTLDLTCVISAGSWQNVAFAAQSGAFAAEFDATPNNAAMDGVMGLSNGPAAAYSSLAAIVRFNASGMIDAINGGVYAASAAIPYSAGTTYHVRFVVSVPAHTYSVYVRSGSNAEQLLASNFSFRTEQAAASALNNLGLYASVGSETVCNLAVTCVTSAGSWQNVAFAAQSGAFVAEFDATPNNAAMDGVMGLSNGPAAAYSSLAAIVRFNTSGMIDAINGGVYAASAAIPYSAGTTYHFRFVVSVPAHTYSVYVRSGSNAEQLLASNFSFRTEQAAASALNNLGLYASVGSETICNLAVTCVTSAGSWQNVAFAPQSGSFAAEFDATPNNAAMDGVVGLSNGPAAAYSSLAAIVRFNASGMIDALSGGVYAASAAIPYSAGTTYHFRFVVSVPAHTYSVYVRSGSDAEQLLASNFSFRTEQAAASALNNLGLYASVGSETVCMLVVTVANDTTPPMVSMTAPAAGSTVAGTVTVSASATDNVGVVGVQFKLDGANLGTEVTAAPYTTSWNTTLAAIGVHTLTAVARDAAGNTATAPAVSLTVVRKPTITSFTPTSGPVGTMVTISGTDFTGVTAVTFNGVNGDPFTVTSATAIQDSVPMGATTGPLSVTTTGGMATSASVFTVVNDATPPAVSITAPVAGATVTGTITVSVSAADNVGVVGVQFKLDGANLGAEVTAAPYTTGWNTAVAAIGAHTLTAVARDAAGNTATAAAVSVTVADTTPPAVSMTAPSAGSMVSGTLSVSASATDHVGVVGVQVKLDGPHLGAEVTTAPYLVSWNPTLATNGAHNLTAVARDAAGNTATSVAISVTVLNDTTPPTVSMTAPAAGATVGGTITVSASATDDVGVVGVQFKLDGVNLGSLITAAPYTLAWITTTASNGTHTLTAVARDAARNTATSSSVTVTVFNDSTPPAVSLTAPANGATVAGTVTISASATDNVGVVGVQFMLDGANLGAEVTTAPYATSWNTALASAGAHILTAVARDAAGNMATTASVSVTVADTTPPALSLPP